MSQIPFILELSTKAVADPIELESGALIVSGLAIRFDETDREGERFFDADGNLWKGVQKFVAGHAPLVHNHRIHEVLGRVLSAEKTPEGIRVKALIDPMPMSSPLRHLYEQIRRKRIQSFSFGGLFHRRVGLDGIPEIVSADFLELSVTAGAVSGSTETSFEILAQKALTCPEGKAVGHVDDLLALQLSIKQLKEKAMTLEGRDLVHPKDRHDIAPLDPFSAEAQASAEHAAARRDREEARKTDGVVEGETVKMSYARMFDLGRVDKYGNIPANARPSEWGYQAPQAVPREISPAERNYLFGLPNYAPREPTVEQIFAMEAKLAEKQRAADEPFKRITDKFDQLRKQKDKS